MTYQNNIRIYSFYYKNTIIPIANGIYFPVMAGNTFIQNQRMTGDDSGESISEKNKYYSELTGIYWVWKNTKQDITGTCHYRRYFTLKEPVDYKAKKILYFILGLYKKRYGLIYTNNIKRFGKRILNEDEISAIFQSYDAILPVGRKLKYSVKEHYRRYHNLRDLEIIEEIIKSMYPEYLSSFYMTLNSKQLYANNMFILPVYYFEKLMDWLFSILFEFEKRINLENYTGYQQRIFGFIGERLLTVWFYHENLKIKELPLIYFKKIK